MEQMEIFTYDGSFKGFLTLVQIAVFEDHKLSGIQTAKHLQTEPLFGTRSYIQTDNKKAWKLWELLGNIQGDTQRYIYYAFLSERIDLQFHMYRYIHLILGGRDKNSDECFQLREQISPWAHRVGKEKRHAETNMAFRTTANGVHLSGISPLFNILPLLSKYCRLRFRDSAWMVVDQKRNQILYNQDGRIVLSYGPQGVSASSKAALATPSAKGESNTFENGCGPYPLAGRVSSSTAHAGPGKRQPARLERTAV
jgi:probable DNA metabolism protein